MAAGAAAEAAAELEEGAEAAAEADAEADAEVNEVSTVFIYSVFIIKLVVTCSYFGGAGAWFLGRKPTSCYLLNNLLSCSGGSRVESVSNVEKSAPSRTCTLRKTPIFYFIFNYLFTSCTF